VARDEFEFDFATSRFENIGRTRNHGLEFAAGRNRPARSAE